MLPMVDQNERNAKLAEEFRANGGRVSEPAFEGATLILLHTRGRKSGREYVNPMRYLPDHGRYIVFASHQGADTDPDWCTNLMAAGTTIIEVDDKTLEVRAIDLEGEERDELYRRQVELHPTFGEYEKRTTRKIPVIALEPIS
jgi:deazaflavin-dependent oxidoreductase (nitroreductase family)